MPGLPWAKRKVLHSLSPRIQRWRTDKTRPLDRKPIDPPPIVQLLDKRSDGKSGLYDSKASHVDPEKVLDGDEV